MDCWFFAVLIFCPLVSAASAEPSIDEQYQSILQNVTTLTEQRRLADAENVLTQTLRRAQGENAHFWVPVILNDLGAIYAEEGKYLDAEREYERSIADSNQDGTEKSPATALTMGNLASLYYEAAQFTKAAALLEQSIAILKTSALTGQPLASQLNNLGVVYLAQHKKALAEATAEDALAAWKAAEGTNSAGAAFSYSLLGAVYNDEHKTPEAESALLQALSTWQKIFGPEDVRTAKSIANLGAFYLNNGQMAEAAPLFERAKAVFDKAGLADLFVLHFLENYAFLERKSRHRKEAKDLLRERQRLETTTAANVIAPGVIDVSGISR
jgi:tetratricopeptide (TPR) repeat protein